MLSTRNAILAGLAVFVFSMVAGTVSLMGPPDSNGAAVDSFGTRRDGYRGAYELLQSFGVEVVRQIEPPSDELPESACLVLWMPHVDLVANEPAYLTRLLPWVERGGRLVVAVSPPQRSWLATIRQAGLQGKGGDLWTTLELEGVQSMTASVGAEADENEGNRPIRPAVLPPVANSDAMRREQIRRGINESLRIHAVTFASIPADVSGTFEKLQGRLRQLQVPTEAPGGLSLNNPESAKGLIECQPAGETPWTVAAAFERGRGEIIVVGEPMLLMNASIGQADNGVFAHDLLAAGRQRVVFDEFYHGLSVRGNPLWLLTKSSYLVVTLAIVGVLLLELWRRAILLGPPLGASLKSRRTIIEYIEAMARFLYGGRDSSRFLLGEVRAGVLRTVGERVGLSPSRHDPDSIAARLARRSQREADHFREAMQQLDSILESRSLITEADAIRHMQRLSKCL